MESKIDHSERAHHLLSPSGSHRWLSCPPSARLGEKVGGGKNSVFAQEGTFAHELANIRLLEYKGVPEADTVNALHELGKQIEEFNAANRTDFSIEAMEGYVQEYVDFVIGNFEELLHYEPSTLLLIEERFTMDDIIPSDEGADAASGSVDAVIVADAILDITDLKYGRGIAVSAVENPQLMLYAYGVLTAYQGCWDIKRIRLNIVQPRINNFSSWEISIEDLVRWAQTEVVEKARQAHEGKGEFCAGEHCQFCPVKGQCRHLAELNLSMAKHGFEDPALLTDDEIAEVLQKLPKLEDWANGVRAYAFNEAVENGKKWPGFKLVASRTVRQWSNSDEVASILELEGYSPEQIYNRKLKGIGDMEKLVGKKAFDPLLGSLLIKPEGQPTLVNESDKRPALELGDKTEQARQVFTD